jgi:uncharacterized membrane protein YkvI
MSLVRIAKAYVIPAAIFQSVGIGGGYGTGRELVEYFTIYGAHGGVYAIVTASIGLGLILALSYEFCRQFEVYDYRIFFKALIGRYWILFEIIYLLVFILVLAVVASAAGVILHDQFSVPEYAGTFLMMVITASLIFFGREWVLKMLTLWAVFISTVFIIYFFNALPGFSTRINTAFELTQIESGWFISGIKYALICSVIIPAVFFIARGFENRKEAILSGFISAIFFMSPALLFHVSFSAWMPEMNEIQVPTYWTIKQMNMPVLLSIYSIAIFGTFVQTGAGFIQGLVERIDTWFLETHNRDVPRSVHLAIALIALAIATGLSHIGIITLIAKGYTFMGWCLFVIYIIPLCTIGAVKIFSKKSMNTHGPETIIDQEGEMSR